MTHPTGWIALTSLLLLALAGTNVACSDDDAGTTDDTRQLTLNLTGFTPLGADFVYEGWLIVDGSPVTTGRFDVVDGQTAYTFDVTSATADGATAFVLTIEPATGDDPAPADSKVLGGELSGGSANLSTAFMAALGTDFASAAGSFVLETPTTGDVADDYAQGIWYLDPSGPSATLTLPDLPAGWIYEGWVVGPEGPVSTGTFSAVDEADGDGAGPTAGSDAAPPFPGQDFIDPGVVLTDFTAVITVEPVPDNSPAPYDLKPLAGAIADGGAGVLQDLSRDDAPALPTGSVVIE